MCGPESGGPGARRVRRLTRGWACQQAMRPRFPTDYPHAGDFDVQVAEKSVMRRSGALRRRRTSASAAHRPEYRTTGGRGARFPRCGSSSSTDVRNSGHSGHGGARRGEAQPDGARGARCGGGRRGKRAGRGTEASRTGRAGRGAVRRSRTGRVGRGAVEAAARQAGGARDGGRRDGGRGGARRGAAGRGVSA